jgi:UDP-N-acetyl-D-mannosaminuronate dehydrogenase
MTDYTVEMLRDKLNEVKLPLNGTNIGMLGIAYKANVDDDRESPYYIIKQKLEKYGAKVHSFDPFIKEKSSIKTFRTLLKKSDAIVLITDHDEFVAAIDGKALKEHNIKVVIDGKNVLSKKDIEKYGIIYKGIGR